MILSDMQYHTFDLPPPVILDLLIYQINFAGQSLNLMNYSTILISAISFTSSSPYIMILE